MAWYTAEILFALPPQKGKRRVLCQTCSVLLRALTAMKAYRKGLSWASKFEQRSGFRLVGIRHINEILDEQIGDGTEIGGSLFYRMDAWERRDELIPDPEDIPIMYLEADPKTTASEIVKKQHRMGMVKDISPEK